MARRASLLSNLLTRRRRFRRLYAYCQKEILDVPEHISVCAEFDYRYELGVAKYSDITSSAPCHSVSSSSCDDALFWAGHGFCKPVFFLRIFAMACWAFCMEISG